MHQKHYRNRLSTVLLGLSLTGLLPGCDKDNKYQAPPPAQMLLEYPASAEGMNFEITGNPKPILSYTTRVMVSANGNSGGGPDRYLYDVSGIKVLSGQELPKTITAVRGRWIAFPDINAARVLDRKPSHVLDLKSFQAGGIWHSL